MKVGLYFGSFNPPHHGHVHIALQSIDQFKLDEVWFIVSPQNPFKKKEELTPESDRLAMVELACVSHPQLIASNIEFSLPRPSYTCETLRDLVHRFPHTFLLLIGEDNWQNFHLWRDYEWILHEFQVVIYHRTGAAENRKMPPHLASRVQFINGEPLDVSATELRKRIARHESTEELLDAAVSRYIQERNLYELWF